MSKKGFSATKDKSKTKNEDMFKNLEMKLQSKSVSNEDIAEAILAVYQKLTTEN